MQDLWNDLIVLIGDFPLHGVKMVIIPHFGVGPIHVVLEINHLDSHAYVHYFIANFIQLVDI